MPVIPSASDIQSRSPSEVSNTSNPAEPGPESGVSRIQEMVCEQPSTLTDIVHTPAGGNSNPKQDSEERDIESSNKICQIPSYLGSCPANQDEEIIITAIRATDVALGLRRLPIGFFVLLHHCGLEWRTDNKPSLMGHDIVTWNGPVPISSDMSATICVEVYASFEFYPMVGSGEPLRKLTVTVKQLLDHNETDSPFTFLPKDGDVMSPCTSIFVAVEQQKRENNSPSTSETLGPRWLTPESRSELEEATNRGHSALLQYRTSGEKQELEQSIREFEHALSITSTDHPSRGVTQSNLAMAELHRFQVEGSNTCLEAALRMYHDALAIRPIGHPDRPATLLQLATVHLLRFHKRGNHVEEQQAQRLLKEVLGSVSIESHAWQAASVLQKMLAGQNVGAEQPNREELVEPDATLGFTDEESFNFSVQLLERFKRFGDLADLEQTIPILRRLVIRDNRYFGALQNLGTALYDRFNRLGELADLEDAISSQRDAIKLTPHGHPSKPSFLNSLGSSLGARFLRLGELSDLEDAISSQKDAVDLALHGHPGKSGYLHNLGTSLTTRFERLGELSDLEDAILRQGDAVDLVPHAHPNKPIYLTNLGTSLRTRFLRLGELSDLEDAILKQRGAVDLIPHDHPNKPIYLTNLGISVRTRFLRLGVLNDLEDAISRLRDAIELTPHGHPDEPYRLNSLGISFFTRFEHLGELSDLEDAISRSRGAIYLIPHGHPDKPGHLNCLGTFLRTRFERLGKLNDLEDAISRLRDAVDLTPHGHPDSPSRLNNLGNSLTARFERLGELSDLEDAVSRLRDAIDLTPLGHPDMPSRLSNLGTSLRIRFERLGELSDLEDAVSKLKDAIDLTPHGHPDKPGYLTNLGNTLRARFERLGEPSDLEDAISKLRDAVNVIPHDHPAKPTCFTNLGISLNTRFECLGELSDLEDAISTLRDAVDFTPYDHPDKPRHLNNLGISLRIRFEHLGEPSDLEDAISSQKDAVDLTSHGHPDKPSRLSNLCISLGIRFRHLGELSDLEDAISRLRDTINLTPHGHHDRPVHMNNLGISLAARFECLSELSDLEDAISRLRDAVNLTPHGHPDKPIYLTNLGISVRTRFLRLGELSDLEDAISWLRDAVDLTPYNHPSRPLHLMNLGKCFTSCFDRFGECQLEQALSMFSHAASSPIGRADHRFHASLEWILCACRIRHPSLLHACSVALNLIPQLAWIGHSLTHRYQRLTRVADILREAAAAALSAGFPEAAVEWLEQGRSIIWGELFQLRSSYEELSLAHPEHARQLRRLSVELDRASVNREMSLEQTLTEARSSRQATDRQRRLAIERDKLLQDIRRLPGFEQFLRRKRFSQLRASCHAGPVVVLNAAETRCDALIVLADVDHVIHVPLTKLTLERSTNLQCILTNFVRHAREGRLMPHDEGGWEHIVSPLWQSIVKPVLDALAISVPANVDLPRIFWCPTGPLAFVPIHAAGLYDRQHVEPGHKVFDFVVSSYVPTLSILSQISNVPPRRGDLRLLLVRQPSSDGQGHLPGVAVELGRIKDIVRGVACTTLLETSDGTVEEVLKLMKEAEWVHFACHGVQDGLNSGLCLADKRRLKLRELAAFSRPKGGLAFLSACQTAKGEQKLPEEAIHMAAGMLFAGYGGVVGTMWSISDRLAPDVTRDVYAQLFRKGTTPDYRDAALALHDAVDGLRRRGVPFQEWIPFIHVGL